MNFWKQLSLKQLSFLVEKKWKVAVNYKSSTIHIVPDDKQQLQGSPELSKKLWMDFSQDGKRQTVTELKKSDILYNEELKKIPVMYLSNNIINVFFVHLTCIYIYISFLFSTLHMYFVLINCKKIGRQVDAEGKDDIDKNMCNISKSSASESCGWFMFFKM